MEYQANIDPISKSFLLFQETLEETEQEVEPVEVEEGDIKKRRFVQDKGYDLI